MKCPHILCSSPDINHGRRLVFLYIQDDKLFFLQSLCFKWTQQGIYVLLGKTQGYDPSSGSITASTSTISTWWSHASILEPRLHWHFFFVWSYDTYYILLVTPKLIYTILPSHLWILKYRKYWKIGVRWLWLWARWISKFCNLAKYHFPCPHTETILFTLWSFISIKWDVITVQFPEVPDLENYSINGMLKIW